VKVLLSALACEPGHGSEPEVGFRALLASARRHETWALVNQASVPGILRGLDTEGVPRDAVHLEGIDFGVSEERFKRLTAVEHNWYYNRWQGAAGRRALRLDREVGFDVVHHVTLASYWTKTGVAVVPKPLVWGPVGGGVTPPLALLTELGMRGLLTDGARILGRPLLGLRPSVKATKQAATVVLAQNQATAGKLDVTGAVRVLSNSLAVDLPPKEREGDRIPEVLFIGRMIPWKAPLLALRTFRHVSHPGAVLRFVGKGGERRRLLRAARRWGLEDRVAFDGWIDRDLVLDKVAKAAVVIHPSLHEEAGLCIAEALSLGTPVVCLDHGGPREVVDQWGSAPSTSVAPRFPDATARAMAAAVDGYLAASYPVLSKAQEPATSFGAELLAAYDLAAQTRRVVSE
jgi:glycosyltransferase involved in cell wall biosynthesis